MFTVNVRLNLINLITLASCITVFQERSPPLVDDFLYICDDTYTRDELLGMERALLKAIGFDIGMPLSYTFLRRYAQVASEFRHISFNVR